MLSYWKKIQQDTPNAHAALQRVAAKVYEEASTSIQLDQSDGIEVEEAIELGFLLEEEEKLFFPNPEILKEYLIEWH